MLLVLVANGTKITGLVINVGNGAIILVVWSLLFRARRTAARLFDDVGVTRGDKRRFDWNDFRGVTSRIDINLRSRRKYLWRVELVFADGETAWIIPNRVKNYDEVFEYLATLPRAIEIRT